MIRSFNLHWTAYVQAYFETLPMALHLDALCVSLPLRVVPRCGLSMMSWFAVLLSFVSMWSMECGDAF